MKTNRLALSALALLGLAGLVQWLSADRDPSRDPRVGQPLLDSQVLPEMDRFVMESPQGRVELEKRGSFWWLVGPEFPADAAKLRRLVQQLSGARVSFFVAQGPEAQARFGVDAGHRLEFWQGSEIQAQVRLGRYRIPGGDTAADHADHQEAADGTYVGLGESVYLVKETLRPPVELESWKLDQLLTLPKDQIKALRGPGWEMSRPAPEDGFALGLGQVAGPRSISGRTRLLGDWRFNEALEKDGVDRSGYGPAQRFELETFGGAELGLVFHAALEPGGDPLLELEPGPGAEGAFHLASLLAERWVFKVPAWQLKAWAEPPTGP